MSTTWIMSDLHLGHKNICNYRPQFNSPEQHDSFIIDNVANTVGLKKRHILWILGDCFFTEQAFEAFFNVVQCQVNWIIGNHDTDNTERQMLVKRFCKDEDPRFGKIGSLFKHGDFWLTHHPIHPMELRGRKNIHGHTHQVLMELANGDVDDRYINVCCEHVNYTPVLLTKTSCCINI